MSFTKLADAPVLTSIRHGKIELSSNEGLIIKLTALGVGEKVGKTVGVFVMTGLMVNIEPATLSWSNKLEFESTSLTLTGLRFSNILSLGLIAVNCLYQMVFPNEKREF